MNGRKTLQTAQKVLKMFFFTSGVCWEAIGLGSSQLAAENAFEPTQPEKITADRSTTGQET